jgi:hypothetical protein
VKHLLLRTIEKALFKTRNQSKELFVDGIFSILPEMPNKG